jgi:outer membrane lipoprotein-sorting protein
MQFKMNTIFLAISSLFLFTNLVSVQQQQEDKKAKSILDELSAKTKGYNTIKAEFIFTIVTREKKTETQNGTIQLKGDKYKLDIKGQQIYCDGKTVWTYMKDAKEVQINNVTPPSDENINPSTIFTVYEKGFKYKFDKEEVQNGNTIQIIDLYPNNPDKKKLHTVKLQIDKAKKQVTGIILLMKDGSTYTYTIKNFSPNIDINESTFTYDPKAHPGVDVVDLRD